MVFRGLVSEWPAVRTACASDQAVADYLLKFYNDQPVTVYQASPEAKGRIFYNEAFDGFNFERGRQNLSEILQTLLSTADKEDAPGYYVGSTMVEPT